VHCIYQDQIGYIWIGSIRGLQRYDGNKFVNYTPDIRNGEALQFGNVTAIFEDSKHRLWVGAGGPGLLNRNTGKFYNYNLHLTNSKDRVNGVAKFMEDVKGDIWVMNSGDFLKLNPSTNQFQSQGSLAGIAHGIFPGFMEQDKKGNIWFVTNVAITCYDPVSQKIIDKKNNPAGLKIFDARDRIASFVIAGNNAWIGYQRSRTLYRYSFSANTMSEFKFDINEENKKHSINEDFDVQIDNLRQLSGDSILAIIDGEGIALCDPLSQSFTEILINNDDPNGLHSDIEFFGAINSFRDREGNIWMGSNRGLNIFNPRKKAFRFYGSSKIKSEGHIPALSVSGFLQSPTDSDIYVSYYYPTGALVRLSPNLQFKKKYAWVKNGSTDIAENQLWYMYLDEAGKIWLPNQAKTILKLDTKTDQLSLSNDSTLYGNINSISRDDSGNTWLGTWGKGLKKIDGRTREVSSYLEPPAGSAPRPKTVLCLFMDGDSLIWTGTNGFGFLCFNKKLNKFTQLYLNDEKDTFSLSNNSVNRIISYNNDTLLLATSAGINIFDKKKKIFTTITGKDGFSANSVETIELDENKNLWVGCDGGFYKIDMHDLSITSYGIGDGLIDDNFINLPFFKMKDGRFLVSATKGFMAFRPSDLTRGDPPPAPVITGFKVLHHDMNVDSLISSNSAVRLSYKENAISIEFSSLQFNSSDKLKYYYQLEGADEDWVAAGGEQTANYNQLKNGSYLFKVKCINRFGLVAESAFVLKIVILPPWWKTWWFILFLIFALAGIAFFLFSWSRKKRKDKELLRINHERQIAAMEMKTLRAQMNPHFIFNSLNSINTFILKSDEENASEYLNKFSRLVRLILDNSRNDWVMLENELKALELYIELESIRFENKFSYDIIIDPAVSAAAVLVPPLIIQPYVENAIWHGLMHRKESGGMIKLRIWKENDNLLLQVEDNGVGRVAAEKLKGKKSELHRSHGMKITEERLDIVNDIYHVNATVKVTDLYDEHQEGSGTIVLLTIKYRANAGHNN